ncbi:MAG: pullulanase-type alpha-1,6-glucosidase [Anaerolineae bacterium]|nr:pullulanase-type alpha-1,6-glucosidase [Anaerolineae bacterium]
MMKMLSRSQFRWIAALMALMVVLVACTDDAPSDLRGCKEASEGSEEEIYVMGRGCAQGVVLKDFAHGEEGETQGENGAAEDHGEDTNAEDHSEAAPAGEGAEEEHSEGEGSAEGAEAEGEAEATETPDDAGAHTGYQLTSAQAPQVASAPQQAAGDVVDVLAEIRAASIVGELIVAQGLDAALREAEAVTIFAPINSVFTRLDEDVLADLTTDSDILNQILTYHVVPGVVLAADLSDGQTLETLQGETLTVTQEGNFFLINGARIIQPDRLASNGAVHLINDVLLPSVAVELIPEPNPADQGPPVVDVPTGEVDPAMVQGLFNPNGHAFPTSVTLAGSFQDELGCANDWAPECEATFMEYNAGNDIWSATLEVPAGEWEYKAALNATWDVSYGANANAAGGSSNVTLSLDEDERVTFFYDHKTGWVTDNVNSVVATLPGTFNSEIGCPPFAHTGDWEPSCLRMWLQDSDGDGIYTFMTPRIPAGDYLVKVAINRDWGENYGVDGARGGADIPFNVPADRTLMVFAFNPRNGLLTIAAGGTVELTPEEEEAMAVRGAAGNIALQQAHWVAAPTIAWQVDVEEGYTYRLFWAAEATLELTEEGLVGGESVELTPVPEGISVEAAAKFPHLADLPAFALPADALPQVPDILKGQLAVAAFDADGMLINATGLQIPGVLDDLFTYGGALGTTWDGEVPTVAVWAPTAQNVQFHLFADETGEASAVLPMELDPATGVWSITGEPGWKYQYYLFEVTVFVPSTGAVEVNLVTDPYSYSLAMGSTRSQLVDLRDSALAPEGWDTLVKPQNFEAFEDIVIYEMHVRDFSIFDERVPEELRGKYLAFALEGSAGIAHLRALQAVGLTHLHLLPAFDVASVLEDPAARAEPDSAALASFPADSDEQRALINEVRDLDAQNWGYDPFHFTAPEGSYATDPSGITRILEFRQMVMALNQLGLNVVMDVVYNHTNQAGQGERSVFDRIVPGYYHRLNETGGVHTSTCCPNTASEHNMFRKFMVDSLLTWTTEYKIDGYRFDLMGHHMVEDMLAVQEALQALTIADDGVDGRRVYLYGEGWNFGEVENNARGTNATQLNLAGTGIGTFSDRLRDAVRGGSPVRDSASEQGFITLAGIVPNAAVTDEAAEAERMLLFMDQIRVGLAGNLATYTFENREGERVAGANIPYGGNQRPLVITWTHKNTSTTSKSTITKRSSIGWCSRCPPKSRWKRRSGRIGWGRAFVLLSQGRALHPCRAGHPALQVL